MDDDTPEHKAHMRVIDRCIKRRRRLRPADVVDRIRVPDAAWADAVASRMKAAGYGRGPRRTDEPAAPTPVREVALSVLESFALMAADLAAAQGITPEQFMGALLSEGLYEAYLEMNAQRNAFVRVQRDEERYPSALRWPPEPGGDVDDDIPF